VTSVYTTPLIAGNQRPDPEFSVRNGRFHSLSGSVVHIAVGVVGGARPRRRKLPRRQGGPRSALQFHAGFHAGTDPRGLLRGEVLKAH
jgi:hypothetical protein